VSLGYAGLFDEAVKACNAEVAAETRDGVYGKGPADRVEGCETRDGRELRAVAGSCRTHAADD